MRLIFAGTPEFAVTALAALLATEHRVALVLTQPDRRAGRGMKPAQSPVKKLALQAGIELLQPRNLAADAVRSQLASVRADVMVVAAYGVILPKAVLEIPRLGAVNIHASLLPRWRGAAPIQRALLAGDSETGISIMQMDPGLDTGPILLRKSVPILHDDTARTLHDRLAALGAQVIVDALARLARGELKPEPQPAEGATYAPKIEKSEARLDWTKPALLLEREIRAFNPYPVAHARLDGAPLRIWRARATLGAGGLPGQVIAVTGEGILVACGEGALVITEVQRAGGNRIPAARFVQGFDLAPGAVLVS